MFIPYLTKNFEDTPDRIKKLVSVLDKSWFRDIQNEFLKKCSAGEDHYIEGPTEEEWEDYLKTVENDDEREYLSRYGPWVPVYFPNFYWRKEYTQNKYCGSSVSSSIITASEQLVKEMTVDSDYEHLSALIETIKQWIDEEAADLTDYFKDFEYKKAIADISKKCKWDIDNNFNSRLKALYLKRAMVERRSTKILPVTEVVRPFDFSEAELDSIIYPTVVQKFKEIERRLVEDGLIDNDLKWQKSNDECAALIQKLNTQGYLKQRKPKRAQDNWITKTVKPFFQKRYAVNFTKQLQPKYRESNRLTPYFSWIESPEK